MQFTQIHNAVHVLFRPIFSFSLAFVTPVDVVNTLKYITTFIIIIIIINNATMRNVPT